MTKKAVKETVDTRPSLSEIKADEKAGRLIYVEYRGFKQGFFVLPKHKPEFPNDPELDELIIAQFEPRTIRAGWLDDAMFEDVYLKNRDIHVWRTNVPITPRDLTLPDKINKALSDSRRNLALRFATSDYDLATPDGNKPMHDLVQLEPWGEGISADYSYMFLKKEYLPFLRALKFYEQKFTARKNVLHDIDVRIKALEISKSPEDV